MSGTETGGGNLKITVGQVDKQQTKIHALHKAARSGKKKDLMKAIVDLKKSSEKFLIDKFKNDAGQTALFVASYFGQLDCAIALMANQANPNTASTDGKTALHAACYHGTANVLSELINHGGLMTHKDKANYQPHEYITSNPDKKNNKDLGEYVRAAELHAMTDTGRNVLLERQSTAYINRRRKSSGGTNPLFKGDQKDGSDGSIGVSDFESLYNFVRPSSAYSLGYGMAYVGKQQGAVSTIPLIPDSGLVHDEFGLTFNNGAYMVMESMVWDKTHVSVKRMHHKSQSGGSADLLIEESNYLCHLRHPHIFMLMGLCQTHNLESIVLLFERVKYGSLYLYLHDRFGKLSTESVDTIMLQMADALVYVHSRGIVHCSITSHAVQLCCTGMAKLGNFEYAINYRDAEEVNRRQWIALKQNTHANAVVNWMAPELLSSDEGGFPCEESDMYSYCALLWEMLTGKIPWSGLDADHVIEHVLDNEETLPLQGCSKMKSLNEILSAGLSLKPVKRKINFEYARDILVGLSKQLGSYDAEFESGGATSENTNESNNISNNNSSAWQKSDGITAEVSVHSVDISSDQIESMSNNPNINANNPCKVDEDSPSTSQDKIPVSHFCQRDEGYAEPVKSEVQTVTPDEDVMKTTFDIEETPSVSSKSTKSKIQDHIVSFMRNLTPRKGKENDKDQPDIPHV